MKMFFLHTVWTYTGSEIPVRTHPDTDTLPVITIYTSAGVTVEIPTVTKTTDFLPTGHYIFPLDSNLYTVGDTYYFISRWVDDGDPVNMEPEWFEWGFANEAEGDAALGYNRNLMKTIDAGIRTNLELMALCPNIRRASSFQSSDSTVFPVLVIGMLPQVKIPNANQQVSTQRRTFLRFRFYHKELNDKLLIQLNDMLNTFLLEGDDYDGFKFEDANNVFHTFSLIPDVYVEDEPGVVWDDVLKLYRIGCRHIHDGSSQ